MLRATNIYLDPAPWTPHDSIGATVLSFVNTEKYPPSTLYLAMTLGPALLALAALTRRGASSPRSSSCSAAFPSSTTSRTCCYSMRWRWCSPPSPWRGRLAVRRLPIGAKPESYGLDLPGVYLMWIIAVALLYLPCRWYAEVKRRHGIAWLSYL